jgi:hypothetical protein
MSFDTIINKFEKSANDLIYEMVNESKYNLDLKLQLLTNKENNFLYVDDCVIEVKKLSIFGCIKNYYNVYYRDELIAEELCLSISAINVIKNILDKNPKSYIDNIITLDKKYSAILNDIFYYKKMIKNVKTQLKKDILLSKYEGKLYTLSRIKEQIQKNHK